MPTPAKYQPHHPSHPRLLAHSSDEGTLKEVPENPFTVSPLWAGIKPVIVAKKHNMLFIQMVVAQRSRSRVSQKGKLG